MPISVEDAVAKSLEIGEDVANKESMRGRHRKGTTNPNAGKPLGYKESTDPDDILKNYSKRVLKKACQMALKGDKDIMKELLKMMNNKGTLETKKDKALAQAGKKEEETSSQGNNTDMKLEDYIVNKDRARNKAEVLKNMSQK